MEDKERIEYIMLEKQLSNTEFCIKAGISAATLSHILSGRSKPSLTILRGVVNGFPDLNPEWVLLGTGDMYRVGSVPENGNANDGPVGLSDVQNSQQDDGSDVFGGMADMFGPANSGTPYNNKVASARSAEKERSGASRQSLSDIVRETLEIVRGPQRKIVEVRIFFDDGTYETFSPR